jgi:hypothetical protein
LEPDPQADCNTQPPATKTSRQQLRSFLRLGVAIATMPNSMPGSTSQVAFNQADRLLCVPGVKSAACVAVVTVSVVVAGFASGVIVAGLKEHAATAGNPLHAKLMGVV